MWHGATPLYRAKGRINEALRVTVMPRPEAADFPSAPHPRIPAMPPEMAGERGLEAVGG
jgi:hypothetical protein